MNVLYVEDDRADADLARRGIERHAPQITLEIVDSVAEALRALRRARAHFDVVLTDLQLPDGSGLDLIGEMRANQIAVPVVVVTGRGDEETVVAALRAGAIDYLTKAGDYLERLPLTLSSAVVQYRRSAVHQGRQLRVLYAEHARSDVDLAIRHLAQHAPHIRLEAVADATELFTRLPDRRAAAQFDAVLVDYNLPGMNALDILKEIRQVRRFDIPVVVVTGQGNEESAINSLHLGASDYLVKGGDFFLRLPIALENAHLRSVLEREQAALRESELRLQGLVESAMDGVVTVDASRRVVLLNAAAAAIFQCVQGRAAGKPLDHFILSDGPETYPASGTEPAPGGSLVPGKVRRLIGRRAGGELFPIEASVSELPLRDRRFLTIILRDITERDRADRERVRVDRALRESESRFRQLAENIDQIFWLGTADMDEVLYASPAFETIWGRDCAALYSQPSQWADAIHADDRQRFVDAARHWRRGVESMTEYRVERPDGSVRIVQDRAFPVRDPSGAVYRVARIVQDVTDRREQEARIELLAFQDALTGLPNRTLVLNRLALAVAQSGRSGKTLGLLLIDLDRFSTINDSLGHSAGDQLIQQAGERLLSVLREEDTVARIGGDEFLILLPEIASAEQAAQVAAQALRTLAEPFLVSGQEIHASASAGISLCPRDAADADTLVKYADSALNLAKEEHRGTFRFFSRELDTRVHARLRMENELRRAIPNEHLVLLYQPQVELRAGRVIGVEALVRWNHPDRGLVSPGEFIAIAEESGLIIALGEWVLRAACQQARAWRRAGWSDLRVSVNVSGRQIEHGDLVETVRRILAHTQCDPRNLEIEITESAVMRDPERAIETIRAIHELGIAVSMDDFGTGYSSLAQLKRFPLDRVKIDSSFVRGLPHDKDDLAIVQTIIVLARQLKLEVVAEGVETEAQREYLRSYGCDAMQGFLFSPPVPAREIDELITRRPRLAVQTGSP